MSANQRPTYQPNIQATRFTPSPYADGYAPGHPQPQAIYQTQGGPGVVPNQQPPQSNPAQNLANQQNQARLTPMAQPTAPPTPPTQQQQQSQQAPQYAVQIQQSAGNTRAPQYRSQSQVQRRQPPQQQLNQPMFYQHQVGGVPYGFVIPPGTQIRAPAYGYMPFPPMFNNYAAASPGYGQIPAPSNSQQRQSTPQASVPTMAPAQTNEYSSYQSMEVYPPAMQAPPVTPQAPPIPQTKTVKKAGSKAIQIINPATGKNIFEDDSSASSGTGVNSSGSTGAASSTALVDKAITASHIELNKDEAVEKEVSLTTAEPSTPVVSAMSDGPSVDITPKHQVNKIKKLKPPEPAPQPVPQTPTPQAEPLPSNPSKAEPESEHAEVIPQDNENNNVKEAEVPVPVPVPVEPVVEVPVKVEPVVVMTPLDSNDTNNNNYQQKVTKPESEEKNLKETTKPTKSVEPTPQDSNNNSTDDKAVMTSPSIRNNVPAPAAPKEKEEKPVAEATRKVSVVDGAIDYDDGQWSPANLAGKKYYTRDQLLKLKDLPIAAVPTKLPENVANSLMKDNKSFLTNTLTQTMPLPGMGSMQRVPFDPVNSLTPKFMATQMSGRNPYPKRPSQTGNKQPMPGNGRGSQAGIIKLTLSLQDDVKLNEAENAWKPSHLTKKVELTEEDRTTCDLLSRFRSMLNKLTAENFGYLVEQVKTYKIDTSERLDGVISLLFEKAISEPKFAPTYANLCKEVAFITTAPQGEGTQGKKNTLKGKLITQCQKEFERHREESLVFNDIEAKLREIEKSAPGTKDEEKARLEEEHYKVRQRANGTVKFIGELFKIDMLTSNIMRACIQMLLQEPTEEKIERVCKLLTTIGGKLEDKDGRRTLDAYFSQLTEMLHPAHKVIKSSRIKFEIQNLEDLRNNGWITRRQDLIPKTMDQIQMESDREQQMINYQTRQNAKEDRNRGGNQGNYNRRGQQQQDNDGWQLQQNNKSRMPALQFSKISLPTMNSEGPKLGAPTDFQRFMVNSNKFSALPVDTDTDNAPSRFGGPSGGSKNSSMERGSERGSHFYGNGSSMGAPDGRYSGRSSGSNQGSRNSSQIRSRDNSDGRGGPSRSLQAPPRHNQAPPSGGSSISFSGAVKQPQKAVTPTLPSEPMTQEDIAKNFKEMLTIINNFRDDKLTTETALEALEPLSINKDVLVEIYNKFLDRKDIDRENLMMVVCEMLKTKRISRDMNREALIGTMALGDDLIDDVPRFYEYIAQFYAELLIASVITFQDVHLICEAYLKSPTGGDKMLRFIFTAIEKRHGAARLQQVVADANCDLSQFVSDGNFNMWLEANKFTSMVRHGTRGINDVIAQVKKLLDEKKKNAADPIISYINSTNSTIDATFIRQLTTAIIKNCCEEFPGSSAPPSYKLQNNRLEHLLPVLHRYIDNNKNLELQCIYALQHFAFKREYPSGLLNSTFEILYDNDVLSLEAFEVWRSSDDPNEDKAAMKGVAICSTRQFFTKLEEDKDDDDFGEGEDGDAL